MNLRVLGNFRAIENLPKIIVDIAENFRQLKNYLKQYDTVAAVANAFTVDVTQGWIHELDMTAVVAFTVNNPVNNDDFTPTQILAFRNTSGGTVTTVSFGSAYKIASWTNLTNGFTRFIYITWNPNTQKWMQSTAAIDTAN